MCGPKAVLSWATGALRSLNHSQLGRIQEGRLDDEISVFETRIYLMNESSTLQKRKAYKYLDDCKPSNKDCMKMKVALWFQECVHDFDPSSF